MVRLTDHIVKESFVQLPTPLLMFIVHRYAEARIVAHLAQHGFDDVTLAQGRLAARIDEGGSRLTTLAEAAGVTKQSAGAIVDQLEGAGYVERVPDPTDGRARLIRIAQRGKEAQACAREMEEEVEADLTAHLGRRRMRELRSSLESLREITDPYL